MAEPSTDTASRTATSVFLFTDLVDSTAWKGRLGDEAYTADILRPHNALFRAKLAEAAGAVERAFTGDGFFATFASSSDAVRCALDFHAMLAAFPWSAAVLSHSGPKTRIGIHLGEAVFYDANPEQVTGQAVDLAARVMSLAAGGQTLVTAPVDRDARRNLRDVPGLAWRNHGQYRFKGDDQPLDICEAGIEGAAPLTPPPASDKVWPVIVDPDADTRGWRPAPGLEIPRRDGWFLENAIGGGGRRRSRT